MLYEVKHTSLLYTKQLNRIGSCDLYDTTFYGRNLFRIVISQSSCQCHSLPHQSNICGQDLNLPKWSPLWNPPLRIGFQPCPQILSQGELKVKNTLAYYDTITVFSSFIVKAREVKIKMQPKQNKLPISKRGANPAKIFTSLVWSILAITDVCFCIIKRTSLQRNS